MCVTFYILLILLFYGRFIKFNAILYNVTVLYVFEKSRTKNAITIIFKF